MVGMKTGIAAVSAAVLLMSATAVYAASEPRSSVWTITKTEWSEADEKGFSDFVRAIGLSGCTGTVECLRVGANPYKDTLDELFDARKTRGWLQSHAETARTRLST